MKLVKNNKNDLTNLNDYLKTPPKNSVILTFTPELAEYVLTNLNLHNRPRKTAKILQYSKDMANQKWLLTGETIAFGSDDLLKDGQNRLAACIRANTSFDTHVIFGIDPRAFAVMDTGANRSHSDILGIMGVKNAEKVSSAIRLIKAFQSGKTSTQNASKLTNDELKSVYLNDMDHDLLQRAVLASKSVNRVTTISMAALSSVYYLASLNGDEEKVVTFFNHLRDSYGTARSPQKMFMKRLTELRTNPSYSVTSHDVSVLLTRAWYNFKHNKQSTKADMIVLNTDKIPAI